MTVASSIERISETSPATIEELIARILEYYPQANIELLKKCYDFSEKAHLGQFRRSGEPYILHPLGVAGVIADLRLDMACVVTALLHDTVEDTTVTLEDIEREFGKEVAGLVDGVTKISRISFRNTHEKEGENIRKMILAMGKDVRVVMVKLADRLHNMRTLNHMPYEKQAKIAQETIDIYSPLANRLGISSVKVELEDLSLRYLRPDIYYDLAQKIAKTRKQRERYIDDVKKEIQSIATEAGVVCEVQGRPKHLYSIYKKMDNRDLAFEQIFDVLAFRVVVKSTTECYMVLGLVHSVWKPVPGRFKDFIAMAKTNNYQSLHTTIIGPGGEQIEIQIRTEEMHLIAERGIAAHWKYKEGGKLDPKTAEKYTFFRDLVKANQDNKDPNEFLENIKSDLYESEIFVFTPDGDVRVLPEGATPIDFAYAVHTDVGMRCAGAKINNRIVTLKTKLKSGDTVTILTNATQTPSKDWLKLCITTRAQSKIRWYIKNEERKKALILGRDICEKEFRKYGVNVNKALAGSDFEKFLKDTGQKSIDDILVMVGYGKTTPLQLIEKFAPEAKRLQNIEPEKDTFLAKVFKSAAKKKAATSGIVVDGHGDMLVHYAKCCNPIMGDSIVGFISRGRGVIVHTTTCPRSYEMDSERRVDVLWAKDMNDIKGVARIKIVTTDSPGQLNRVSEAFSQNEVNVISAKVQTTKDHKGIFLFEIHVKDLAHLNRIIQAVQKVRGVIGVERA